MTSYLALPLIGLALIGAIQAMLARRALRALVAQPVPGGPALPVSILKPLHGADPDLLRSLAATFDQQHGAAFEVILGTNLPSDPAFGIAEAAIGATPTPARLITGHPVIGANRKVSQLVHLVAEARHPVLVVADADMRCPPGWLTAVTAPLADPSIGLVTCLYQGEAGDAGPWSRLAALGLDWHFLPNAALGESLGKAEGCYGATMALRRDTLTRVGGFKPLLPFLADDHTLGAAVRRQGLRVVVSPIIPVHVMTEPSLGALWAHELRWARTVRLLNPAGFVGLVFTHPLAWAALALALAPGWPTLAVLLMVFGARLALATGVDAALGVAGGWRRWVWLPARDLLSFVVWTAALLRGSVVWGDRRYRIGPDGQMVETVPTP